MRSQLNLTRTFALLLGLTSSAVAQESPPSDSAPRAQRDNEGPIGADADPELDAELETFEATAEIEAPAREVTRRTVAQSTVRRVAGTRGDVLRGIELMPGVARTSLGAGAPILRGAGFNESATLLNGTPVPFLYHFGGLTSFLSSRLVSDLDLYPGNFSSRYGRVSGGILEVRARDPDSPRVRAAVDLSLIDSALYVEAPLGSATNVAGAVRRSNIDFFFENFVPEDSYSIVAAPTYYDYQLFAVHRLSVDTRLRLLSYGSRDAIELFFAEPSHEDPQLAGSVGGNIAFHRVALELEHESAQGFSANASATLGKLDIVQRIGPLRQIFDGHELYARGEVSVELHPTLRLTSGLDFAGLLYDGRYHGPPPGQLEGDPHDNDPIASQQTVSAEEVGILAAQPAAYVELGYRPLPEVALMPGVRVDYTGQLDHWSIDPRLSARYELSEATTLKSGVGVFTQVPEVWQSLAAVGNPNIEPSRALQFSAGVEHRFGALVKVGLEGFYKRLQHTIVATPNREAPHYENTGRGRIYGGELASEAHWAEGSFAYLAYTLSRSERQDGRNTAFRLFDQDQTHVLSLAFSQDLGRGWEVGARFRVVSGNPITPVTGSVYDARTGVYLPLYGTVNSRRDPTFHQLDLRVEKNWQVGPLLLGAYLDVQNAYNADNPEGARYSYDYSEREAITGLPLFPNLGLKGEL